MCYILLCAMLYKMLPYVIALKMMVLHPNIAHLTVLYCFVFHCTVLCFFTALYHHCIHPFSCTASITEEKIAPS